MITTKKSIIAALLLLVIMPSVVLAAILINSIIFPSYGFEICRILGQPTYAVDSPFSGARECHLNSESYNEADSWDNNYPQYHF